jgi:hypothetical protein
MIDANQTPLECLTKQAIKNHSIEWLRIEYGMTDPVIDIMQKRPDTTTSTPRRDIDYWTVRDFYTLGEEFAYIALVQKVDKKCKTLKFDIGNHLHNCMSPC